MDAAEFVFSRSGYDGATVKGIAKQAKCYESLIYYYFESKDKLFLHVLENAYRKLTLAEKSLKLDFDDPEKALSDVILFLWKYYQKHPELIILLNTENLLKGKHLPKIRNRSQTSAPSEFLSPAVSILEEVVSRGIQKKLFKDDINVIDLYLTIRGLGYFYLSNRYTLSSFLGKDLMAPAERRRWGGVMVDTVFASVRR